MHTSYFFAQENFFQSNVLYVKTPTCDCRFCLVVAPLSTLYVCTFLKGSRSCIFGIIRNSCNCLTPQQNSKQKCRLISTKCHITAISTHTYSIYLLLVCTQLLRQLHFINKYILCLLSVLLSQVFKNTYTKAASRESFKIDLTLT